MIDLYYWPTPNGWKVSIALEELGLPYTPHYVNIGRGEQFEPEFLKIAPNNRIPALVDREPRGGGAPISLFESGAILLYLAEKTGKLLPADAAGRYDALQWLFWQMAGLGPMLGQAHHFREYAPEPVPYAVKRYTDEAHRLYGVLDRKLAGRDFIAGSYSIADIAAWPWTVPHRMQGQDLADFPNVKRWHEAIQARPAVQRGMAVGEEFRRKGPLDEQARQALFGQRAR